MENFDTNDLIERYLKGALSAEELNEVETRIASDADFRAEVELHRQLQDEFSDPKKLELRDMLGDILRTPPAPPEAKPAKTFKILGIALLVLFALWAIWRMTPDKQENMPVAPNQQENQALPDTLPALPDSLPKTPQEPIAMVDKKTFLPNPVFEPRVGNGGIRSTDDQLIEMSSPATGADFSLKNGLASIKFSGGIRDLEALAEQPILFKIFASKSAENTMAMFVVPVQKNNPDADKGTFSMVQYLRLLPGLYYFTVERQADEELLYVGKFTIGAKK